MIICTHCRGRGCRSHVHPHAKRVPGLRNSRCHVPTWHTHATWHGMPAGAHQCRASLIRLATDACRCLSPPACMHACLLAPACLPVPARAAAAARYPVHVVPLARTTHGPDGSTDEVPQAGGQQGADSVLRCVLPLASRLEVELCLPEGWPEAPGARVQLLALQVGRSLLRTGMVAPARV